MKFYVKMTGNNRYAGGSFNWLLIREIKKNNNYYDVKVRIKGNNRYFYGNPNAWEENVI